MSKVRSDEHKTHRARPFDHKRERPPAPHPDSPKVREKPRRKGKKIGRMET